MRENRLYVRIEDDNAGLVDVYGTRRLTEDEWVHVAVVQDGHALRIYLNGELDGLEDGATAGTWTSHLNLANGGLRIGAGSWGDFIGDIDDLIFTDWAPSQAQIINLLSD